MRARSSLSTARTVGRVSSAVRSPRFGAIGLAILHHSAWTPGRGAESGRGRRRDRVRIALRAEVEVIL